MLTPDLALELFVRVASTTCIVVALALVVERLGPAIGGALAGLPIILGPGLFFIAQDHDAAFTAATAAASVLSLCATEAFLLAYLMAAATRHRPVVALMFGTFGWFCVAYMLSPLRPGAAVALLLFAGFATVARLIGRRFVLATGVRRAPGDFMLLLVRGLLAGGLVAVATLAADVIGSVWSGFILTYPIGFSVVAVTLHQRLGAATVVAMMRAGMVGIASLAAFSFTLSLAIVRVDSLPAFILALGASVALTSLLLRVAHHGRPSGAAG